MRSINLDQLRTLVEIADGGSFAHAARRLHLAAPTVSLHIAELESRLGARLLLRERGHVVPTGIGQTLIARARRLLAEAETALDEVARQVEGRAGRVRVGASTGALVHLLPRALAGLNRSAPDIEVEVAVLTSRDSLTRLQAGTLDIGLVGLPCVATRGLRITPWHREPVMALVPASWQAPRSIAPAWLAGRDLILNDAGTHLHRIVTDWFAAGGQAPQARIEINFNDAARSLVVAGYGATLLPVDSDDAVRDPRIDLRHLRPRLWRELGIACRDETLEPATALMLEALILIGSHRERRVRGSARD